MECTVKIINNTFDDTFFSRLNGSFKYTFNKNSKVRDLLEFLIDKTDYRNDFCDDDLLGFFSFYIENNSFKGELDYNLYDFLSKNCFDLSMVKVEVISAYGIGNGIDFEEFAKIRINGNESHNEPHVHIYPINKTSPCYRISLTTFTQLKNDHDDFNHFLTKNKRKIIMEFLKTNAIELKDFYNKATKGIFIENDYILQYDGKKYLFYESRKY